MSSSFSQSPTDNLQQNQLLSSSVTGRWTVEEQIKFEEGLKMYGKNWKKVEDYVKTRSGAQIRSHAQKYFIKLEKQGIIKSRSEFHPDILTQSSLGLPLSQQGLSNNPQSYSENGDYTEDNLPKQTSQLIEDDDGNQIKVGGKKPNSRVPHKKFVPAKPSKLKPNPESPSSSRDHIHSSKMLPASKKIRKIDPDQGFYQVIGEIHQRCGLKNIHFPYGIENPYLNSTFEQINYQRMTSFQQPIFPTQEPQPIMPQQFQPTFPQIYPQQYHQPQHPFQFHQFQPNTFLSEEHHMRYPVYGQQMYRNTPHQFN